jgi:RNA polymerase sigma-70 factor, ECF subfamily
MPLPSSSPDFDYDAALLACARGEQFALRSLFDREARRLVGVALRIVRDRQLAEDVVQEAFIQIWRRASTFKPALGSGRGWIYTVVRHQALSELRKTGHRERPVDDEILQSMLDNQLALEPDQALSARADALGPCIDALDDHQRTSIVFAFVEGYTHAQIAAHLSAPLGTVKSWIRRGLLSLKECLA